MDFKLQEHSSSNIFHRVKKYHTIYTLSSTSIHATGHLFNFKVGDFDKANKKIILNVYGLLLIAYHFIIDNI
jgi:hypothetical protein